MREVFKFGDLTFDRVSQTLYRDGDTVPLTPLDAKVLAVLLAGGGAFVSREQLCSEVWHGSLIEIEGALNASIWRLRRQLREAGAPDLIRTGRGRGYRIAASVQAEQSYVGTPTILVDRPAISGRFDPSPPDVQTLVMIGLASAVPDKFRIRASSETGRDDLVQLMTTGGATVMALDTLLCRLSDGLSIDFCLTGLLQRVVLAARGYRVQCPDPNEALPAFVRSSTADFAASIVRARPHLTDSSLTTS